MLDCSCGGTGKPGTGVTHRSTNLKPAAEKRGGKSRRRKCRKASQVLGASGKVPIVESLDMEISVWVLLSGFCFFNRPPGLPLAYQVGAERTSGFRWGALARPSLGIEAALREAEVTAGVAHADHVHPPGIQD